MTDNPQPKSQLVPADQSPADVVNELMPYAREGVLTSIPPDRPDLLAVYAGYADMTSQEATGQTLEITDYFVHRCEFLDDETGEIVPYIRGVLICKDGTSISTTAPKVLRQLAAMVARNPGQSIDPPFRCQLKAIPGKRGKQLVLAPVEAATKSRK